MKGLTVYKGEGCLRSGKLHRKLNNHELLLQQELVYEGYVDNMNDWRLDYEETFNVFTIKKRSLLRMKKEFDELYYMGDVYRCDECGRTYDDCECPEFVYEDEESVAAGLGFRIDYDGNWVPI